jgi:hypothetical protein
MALRKSEPWMGFFLVGPVSPMGWERVVDATNGVR